MPVANIGAARDLVYGVFATAWATLSAPPPVIYDDKDIAAPDDGPYASVSIAHGVSPQVAIGNAGGRRWRSQARLVIDLYNTFGDGRTAADAQTEVLQAAFRGKNTGADSVTFRSVQIVEMPKSGSRSQTRVVVALDYDEISP